jgi:uncharacterized protein YqjF (DUF2071 family)
VAKGRIEAAESGPFFIADWRYALWVHYQVDAEKLRPLVPFELDLYDGCAYISTAIFALAHLRMNTGGHTVTWSSGSAAEHGFLQIRTYVRHPQYPSEPGALLLGEWLSNPLSRLLARQVYGLPYRPISLDYRKGLQTGRVHVTASDPAAGVLSYAGKICGPDGEAAPRGSLDEFLLERYTMFTRHQGTSRMHRLWHQAWRARAMDVTVENAQLLASIGPWLADARYAGAHLSAGVTDGWIGRPICIAGAGCSRLWRRRDSDQRQGRNGHQSLSPPQP